MQTCLFFAPPDSPAASTLASACLRPEGHAALLRKDLPRTALQFQSRALRWFSSAFCTKREQMSYSKGGVHTLSDENIATGSAPSAFFAPCRLQGDFVCSIRRAGKSTALRALPATLPTSSHLERPMSAPPGIASRPDERPELVPSMGPAPLDHMSRLRRHA